MSEFVRQDINELIRIGNELCESMEQHNQLLKRQNTILEQQTAIAYTSACAKSGKDYIDQLFTLCLKSLKEVD